MEKNLEEIADKLLEGKIDSEQARNLVRNFKINANETIKESNQILDRGNSLLYLENNEEKAYVQFLFDKDCFDEPYLFLQYAESYDLGKGYFKKLFEELKIIAYGKKASNISLEVDCKNDRAISIYEHFGFYSLGPVNTSSENIDRIFMRKDLFYDE